MAVWSEAISVRRLADRFVAFGEKWLILGRSSRLHLPRLRHFSLEYRESLGCDRFRDEFYNPERLTAHAPHALFFYTQLCFGKEGVQ